jgi:hypothetical protein
MYVCMYLHTYAIFNHLILFLVLKYICTECMLSAYICTYEIWLFANDLALVYLKKVYFTYLHSTFFI